MDRMEHYLRPPGIVGRPYLLALLALCALTGWVAFQAVQKGRAAERAEMRLTKAQAARASQVLPPPKQVEPAVLKRWAALQAERDFSWGDVFTAVEKAGSEDVELLAFEPDKVSRTIQLRGEAHDQKALLTFIEALAKQPNLKNVHLTRQQLNRRDRLETIRFEIKAAILR